MWGCILVASREYISDIFFNIVRQVCYYFGLEHQINQMFSFSDFRTYFQKPKIFDKKGSWWNSCHARWINGQTGGVANENNAEPMTPDNLGDAFKDQNGIYSLHFDWIQIKKQSKSGKNKMHSVGAVMLRNDSVEEDRINTERWAMPLMIIPGPREPPSMNIHWRIIGDEFSRLERDGMRVKYAENGEQKEFHHKPFLARFFCDAKAREKLLKCRGAAAQRPCPYCCIESSGNSKIFGYCKPVEFDDFVLEHLISYSDPGEVKPKELKKSVHIGVTDPKEYKYDVKQMKERSDLVERANKSGLSKLRKLQVHRVTGLNDKCHIIWRPDLKALHPIHAVQLPLYHLLLLGLVSNFLEYMFGSRADGEQHVEMKPNNHGVIKIREAPKGITGNCDLQDKCIDTTNWSGFLISSLSCFLETYSCFLFNEEVTGFRTLSAKAGEAWNHLRSAVLYFLRDTEEIFDDWQYHRNEAQSHLEAYAKICEEYMPELCVQNLHVAVCRLADQERFCGRPNISHDLFMERTIRWLKQYKSIKNNHEKTFVMKELLKSSLTWLNSHMADESPNVHPAQEQAVSDEQAVLFDEISSDESYLMGVGTRPVESGLEAALLESHKMGQSPGVHEWKVFLHPSALLKQFNKCEVLKSMLNDQEQTNFSKIIIFRQDDTERLAKVKSFFRITQDGQTVSRGAICDVLKYAEAIHSPYYGTVYKYRKHYIGRERPTLWENSDEDFEARDWCIDLRDVVTKVCHYIRPDDQDNPRVLSDLNSSAFYYAYCATSKSRSGKRPAGE